MGRNFLDEQREICNKYNADFYECDMSLKIGISRNIGSGIKPINGLRIKPTEGTNGWYIWAGEWSNDPDFFAPLHANHLDSWAPLIIPFLALPPGWRFLVAPDYQDVWHDADLLKE